MKAFVCRLCPRRCGALRTPDGADASAFCRCPSDMYVAHAQAHMWEEPPISGTRGSGTIFFSGCGLGCVYCQNSAVSRADNGIAGERCSPLRLTEIMKSLEEKGIHNISMVTGTQFVPDIIAALRIYRPAVPVVWNSGGYEEISVIDALAPYIDIWLPDYKYALSDTAAKYSRAPDYPEKALAAIKRMRLYQPENITGSDGMLKKGMIIRHLVLPLNTRNSAAVLERLAAGLPGVPVSIMSQYTPMPQIAELNGSVSPAPFPELGRRVTAREYDKVCATAISLGIDGYTQVLSSAAKDYIPDFGKDGVN